MVRTRRSADTSPKIGREAATNDKNEGQSSQLIEKDGEEVKMSYAEIQNAIALAADAASKTFGWKRNQSRVGNEAIAKTQGNALSELIPGYVAPMALDSSELDVFKKKRVETPKNNPIIVTARNFKRCQAVSKRSDTNAGNGWFGMESAQNTAEIQADIAVIRNRNYLDPKKFYKSSDFNKGNASKVVQLGTVIEGSMESIYSNRLTKKERKSTLLEEVMGEVFTTKDDYVKKKFGKMQREASEKGKAHKRRRSNKRSKMGRR
jgi:hypothetical protein